MITLIVDGQHLSVSSAIIWTMIIFTAIFVVALYILRSIGLYCMAKKRELDKAYLAFIPFAWVYTACKLIGDVRFLSSTFERFAIWVTFIFSICGVLGLFYDFLSTYPLIDSFFKGNEIFYVLISDTNIDASVYVPQGAVSFGNGFYGYSDFVANQAILDVLYLLTSLTGLITVVINICIYINLFRAYAPNHFILYAVLSWLFGIFAIFVFALRKKTPVNYNEYVRQRYNAWYANGSYYGGPVNNGAPKAPSTPFEEFADKDEIDPGDPFENLGEDKGEKDKDKKDDDYFN